MASLNTILFQLKISDPLNRSTCIGYGQRKPTCGCVVGIQHRDKAKTVLCGIVEYFDHEEIVDEQLEELAKLLHCVRNHRGQAPAVADTWKRSICQYRHTTAGQRAAQEAQARRASSRLATPENTESDDEEPLPITREGLWRTQMDQRIAARYTSSRRLNSSSSSPLSIESQRNASTSDVSISSATRSSHEPDDSSTTTVTTIVTTTKNNIFTTVTTVRTITEQSPPPTTLPNTSPTVRLLTEPSVASIQEADLETVPNEDLPPTPPAAPVRHSHTDCAICLLPYEDDEVDKLWECPTCINKVHIDCFDEWAATLLKSEDDDEDAMEEKKVTCVYCRAVV